MDNTIPHKIVFAIDTNSAGGGERVIATLANYMVERGYETYLINSDSDSSFYHLNDSVKVIKIGLDREKTSRIRRLYSKYIFLKNFFRENKPDAVVAFLFNMEAPAILAGLKTNTRVYTSVRNAPWSYPPIERTFRKLFYPRIAGVVFQSNKVQKYKDFKHLNNSSVIMNPLDDSVKAMTEPVEYGNRKDIIISVARLEKQKNHEMLIRAFSKIHEEFPGYVLHIFGEGSMRNQLTNLIYDLGLVEKVVLEGAVPGAVVKNRDAKLFVMSSDYEGFPNALAEAMVQGIPSISTDFDTGVASDLICNGRNGWLVAVGDTDDLAKKMRHALLLKEKTNEIAKESVRVFERLSSEKICEEWERFIVTK